MSFRLRRVEPEGPGSAIRGAILRETDSAIACLLSSPLRAEGVHAARKAVKRVRAALRLVREVIGDRRYRRENRAFRDASRGIREVRDDDALLEAAAGLHERLPGVVDHAAVDVLCLRLAAERDATRRRVIDEDGAATVTALGLLRARNAVAEWPQDRLRSLSWTKIDRALATAQARGESARASAVACHGGEAMHEWRKQAKHLWHELELLQRHRGTEARRLHRLTDLLGDLHDFTTLRERLGSTTTALRPAIDALCLRLCRAAFTLAVPLYDPGPGWHARCSPSGAWRTPRQPPLALAW